MSNNILNTRLKHRIDSSSNWSANNPVLLTGELGFESNTLKYKIGNGSDSWNLLPYANVVPSELQDVILNSGVMPIITLYLYSSSGNNGTLSESLPASTINLSTSITNTWAKTNTITNTFTQESIAATTSLWQLGFKLTNLSPSATYYVGAKMYLTLVSNSNQVIQLSEITETDAVSFTTGATSTSNDVRLNFNRNFLTQNVPYYANDYFTIELYFKKSGGGTVSANIVSSLTNPMVFTRNGGQITSAYVFDNNGTDTQTQSYRNRSYESTLSSIQSSFLPLIGGSMSNTNLVTNLNADLLDGKHSTEFAASSHTHYKLYSGINYISLSSSNELELFNSSNVLQTLFLQYSGQPTNLRGPGGAQIWMDSNDGTGSGLDADMLDGKHAANTSNSIPISNGTLNANLNADFLDGNHASYFASVANMDAKIYLKADTNNRDVNTTPNEYNSKFNIAGFKTNAAIGLSYSGIGTYSGIIGIRPWSDWTGGNSHELSFESTGGLYHRHGKDVSWNAWKKIIEDDDSRLTDARTPTAHTLDSHSNVTITSNTSGEILMWNGTKWINQTLSEASIAAASHTHRSLYGANGTYTVRSNDEAGNTKFVEFYSNGSYNYIIGNSTNGSAGNMVFQANNSGQVVFNTSGGGPIIMQTNGAGSVYFSTPGIVVNTNNTLTTDASSAVSNKLPNRNGRLMVEERITISQSSPSGGIDGDIWIQY